MRLARLLQLKPGEPVAVAILFGWYFCVIGAAFIARAVRDSLFLAHLSADRLPAMYIATPLVLTLVGLGYARIEGRVRRDRLVFATSIGGAVAMLASRLLLGTGDWIYYALYVAASVIQGLAIMQLWTVASDRFTSRDAKRVFGLIGAGGTAADIVIGGVIAVLAPWMGAENLLFVCAGLLVAVAALSVMLRRRSGPVEPRSRVIAKAGEPPTPGTSHLKLVGVAVVCAVVVVTLVEFQFKAITAVHFGTDRAGMVRYFGVMSVATGVVSFAIQMIATRWVLHRLGVAGAMLVLPLALGAGELALLIAPTLIVATILKAGDETFRFTVNDAASQLVFLPVPSRVRGRWKAVVENAWKPAAQLALGCVLVGYRAVASGRIAPLVILALGVIAMWVALVVRLRRAYVAALAETLRKRPLELDRVDVAAEEAVAMRAALGSSDPVELLGALEMSAPVAAELADVIAPLCDHPDPRIRRAACSALGGIGPMHAHVRARLTDSDRQVRDAALAALLGSDDTARAELRALCASTDAADRLRGAEVMIAAGARAGSERELAMLVADPDPAVARAAIVAAAASGAPSLLPALLARCTGRMLPELATAIAACGVGGEAAIGAASLELARGIPARRELVRALGRVATAEAVAVLVEQLPSEDDELLRSALARALGRALRSSPGLAFDRARIREVIDRELLVAYHAMAAAEELGRAESVALPDGTRAPPPFLRDAPEGAAALISRTLRERQERQRDRVFALLEALHPYDGFEMIHANLGETEAARRANAIEVLDGVLDRGLRGKVVPLVDDSPRYAKLRAAGAVFEVPTQDEVAWIAELLADRSSWMVACTAYYAGVHRIAAVRERLVELSTHTDATISEAAALAVTYLEGAR